MNIAGTNSETASLPSFLTYNIQDGLLKCQYCNKTFRGSRTLADKVMCDNCYEYAYANSISFAQILKEDGQIKINDRVIIEYVDDNANKTYDSASVIAVFTGPLQLGSNDIVTAFLAVGCWTPAQIMGSILDAENDKQETTRIFDKNINFHCKK